jgi:ABC-type lipoprotein export system ATPase subunit
MTLLSLQGVCKRYPDGSQDVVVLDGVSLDVDEGDFVGIWGARRSGKSTLLRIAAGLEPPDDGAVLFDGLDVAKLSVDKRIQALRAGVGFAAPDWRPHRREPVVERVAWPAMSDGHTKKPEAKAKALGVLRRVDMLSCAYKQMGELSLGDLVRVELARALVRGPRLLLVDEPPVLASPSEGRDLYALLRSLGEERDLAVVLASEDADLIRHARRLMAIGRGRLRTTDKAGTVVAFPDRQTKQHEAGA